MDLLPDHIAKRGACDVVVDALCGEGALTVLLAQTCHKGTYNFSKAKYDPCSACYLIYSDCHWSQFVKNSTSPTSSHYQRGGAQGWFHCGRLHCPGSESESWRCVPKVIDVQRQFRGPGNLFHHKAFDNKFSYLEEINSIHFFNYN